MAKLVTPHGTLVLPEGDPINVPISMEVISSINSGQFFKATPRPIAQSTVLSGPDRTEVEGVDGWMATFTVGSRVVTMQRSERSLVDQVALLRDDFLRSRGSDWGPSTEAGTWVTSGSIGFSVVSSTAQMTHAFAGQTGIAFLPTYGYVYDSVQVDAIVETDTLTIDGPQRAGVVVGLQNFSNYYAAMLAIGEEALSLSIVRVQGDVSVELDSVPLIYEPGAGTKFWVKVSHQSGLVRARVWPVGDPEPSIWDAQAQDETFGAGAVGLTSSLDGDYAGGLPATIGWSFFEARVDVSNPSTVTHDTWVRILPQSFAGGAISDDILDWLYEEMASDRIDVLSAACAFKTASSPSVVRVESEVGSEPPITREVDTTWTIDSSFGPSDVTGERLSGSDFNDFLGVTVEYEGEGVDEPDELRLESHDSAGFVRSVFGLALRMEMSDDPEFPGVRIPRSISDIMASGPGVILFQGAVKPTEGQLALLRPGDVVSFVATPGFEEGQEDHIGIYLGVDDQGGMRFISSRRIADGPSFTDIGGPAILNGSGLYATALRAARRF